MSAWLELKNCNVNGINLIARASSVKNLFRKEEKLFGLQIPILRNINFSCHQGETVGFLGPNGSGKSSLLKVIAGIYPIESGERKIFGSLSAIIEMGIGMEWELSGRENIKLIMMYNNMLHRYNKEIEDKIIEFSELGEKIDQPLKNYSSGMISRLSFSASIFQSPDILLLDEVFAVGDANFVQKALDFLRKKISSIPVTIIVSHQEDIIKTYCNRCLYIQDGEIKLDGKTDEVMKYYNHAQNIKY